MISLAAGNHVNINANFQIKRLFAMESLLFIWRYIQCETPVFFRSIYGKCNLLDRSSCRFRFCVYHNTFFHFPDVCGKVKRRNDTRKFNTCTNWFMNVHGGRERKTYSEVHISASLSSFRENNVSWFIWCEN